MDIVSLTCPNCNGIVKRKNNEYFAKCPYCGSEVCFNDIKEEAVIGQMSQELRRMQTDKNLSDAKLAAVRRWVRMRNIVVILQALFGFFAMFLVTVSTKNGDPNEVFIASGSMCLIFGTLFLFLMPLLLGAFRPAYDPITGKDEKGMKVKALFATFGLQLAAGLLGIIIGVIVVALFIGID